MADDPRKYVGSLDEATRQALEQAKRTKDLAAQTARDLEKAKTEARSLPGAQVSPAESRKAAEEITTQAEQRATANKRAADQTEREVRARRQLAEAFPSGDQLQRAMGLRPGQQFYAPALGQGPFTVADRGTGPRRITYEEPGGRQSRIGREQLGQLAGGIQSPQEARAAAEAAEKRRIAEESIRNATADRERMDAHIRSLREAEAAAAERQAAADKAATDARARGNLSGVTNNLQARRAAELISMGNLRGLRDPSGMLERMAELDKALERFQSGVGNVLPAAGGGTPPPPRGPRATTFAVPEGDPERLRQLQAIEAAQIRQSANVRSELFRASAAHDAASLAVRKHGAATTEYLQALARGETSLREFGFQLGATAGKFSTWLVAGSGVFLMLDGMRQLADGAIQASSGVNQLQRVVTETLDQGDTQRQFRNLSEQFNLPMNQVTEAAFDAAKVFHDDLPGAFEATRTLLYAVKVGELDVADAFRFMTSVAQGWNLTGHDTAIVFDQINQAQNRFGIGIRDTFAGMAKASGAFRAAGGDITHLIALMTAASRATGQTGEVVGTALQRAPHFYRMPQNIGILQTLGIDASRDVNTVFEQAFKAAQKSSGRVRRQIAEALFGPQYGARVGVGLLQNFELYQRALAQVNPAQAQGSAQRELERQLRAVSERVKRVSTDLQQLGSALGSAGFLDPFGGLLSVLDRVLRNTRYLVDAFDSLLPSAIRHSVAAVATLYGAMRLARRVGVGESLAANPRYEALGNVIAGDPTRRAGKEAVSRIKGTSERLSQELEQATARQLVAAQTVANLQQEMRVASAASYETEAQRHATLAGIQNQLVIADEEMRIADSRRLAIAQQQLEMQTLLNRVRAAQSDQERVGLASAAGVYGIPTLDRPTTAEPVPIAQLAGQQAKVVEEMAEGATTAATSTAAATAAATVAQAELTATATRSRGLFAAGSELAAGLGRFLFSPMGALTAAFLVVPTLLAENQAREAELKADAAKLAELPDSVDGLLGEYRQNLRAFMDRWRFQRRQAQQLAGEAKSLSDDPAKALKQLQGINNPTLRYNATREYRNALARSLFREQEAARSRGEAVPFRDVGRVQRDFQSQVVQYRQGIISFAELQADFNKRMEEASSSYDAKLGGQNGKNKTRKVISNLRRTFNAIRANMTDFEAALQGSDLQAITGVMEVLQQQIEVFGSSTARITNAAAGYSRAVALVARSPDNPEALKNFSDAQQRLAAIISNAESELQQDLDRTGSAGGRSAAYERYFSRVDPVITRLRSDRATIRSRISRLQARNARELEDARNITTRRENDPGGDAATIEKRQRERDALLEELSRRDKVLARQIRQLLGPRRQQELALVQEVNDLRTARAQLTGGGQSDPIVAATETLGAARANLRSLIRHHANAIDIARAQLEVQQQQDNLLQQQIDNLRSLGEFRTAGIDPADATGVGQSTLQSLRRQLAAALKAPASPQRTQTIRQLRTQIRQQKFANLDAEVNQIASENDLLVSQIDAGAHPIRALNQQIAGVRRQIALLRRRHASEARIRPLLAQLNQLLFQRSDALRQLAQDNINADFELRSSLTDDPVKLAELALKKAIANKKFARTPAEQKRAQAEINNSRRAYWNAYAQSQLDDINFQADIGKLTTDQEISALKRLLNYKHLSREMRRNILRQIYQLEHQNDQELELNVGNIRLPTLYDIRRMAQVGVSGSGRSTQITQVNHVSISANSANAKDVAKEFDAKSSTGLKSILRSIR